MLEKIQKMVATWKFNRVKWVKTLWIEKGIAWAKAGKHQEAIIYYNTALEIDPRHPMAWSFKGEALLELGKFQEAREAYIPTDYTPTRTGIQSFQIVTCALDSRSLLTACWDKLRGNDDFLRIHQQQVFLLRGKVF